MIKCWGQEKVSSFESSMSIGEAKEKGDHNGLLDLVKGYLIF